MELPEQKNQEQPRSSDELEASGDALVIAAAIYSLADAIREHTEKMLAPPEHVEPEDDGSYGSYLDGTPVR